MTIGMVLAKEVIMDLSAPVAAMAQRLADTLGISLEAAVAVALHNLEESIKMKPETEWSVQQISEEAKGLMDEHPRGFTAEALLERLTERARYGLVLEPHAEKQRIGIVLRSLGYKRRQIRFRGSRLLRWFAPMGAEVAR